MRVIVVPAIEPLTIADVKSQLGILEEDDSQHALISRRITEARQWAEDYMQRALITQTLEVRLDKFPSGKIELPFPNLLTVVSVKYIDTAGTEITFSSASYVVDTYSHLGLVRPAFDVVWPDTRDELAAVRIQYTCGYGTTAASVPALLREALILTVGHWMNNQPQSESGVTLARIPFAVRDILDKYSIRVI